MPLHLHLHHSFRPHNLSLPNLSLSNILPGLSLPSLRFRKHSTSASTSSGPSSHSSSSSFSSSNPPVPSPVQSQVQSQVQTPYISHPSPISPSFSPPHGPHTSTSQAPYVHRNRNQCPTATTTRTRKRTRRIIIVPGTAVPDDANFILEFRGRVGGSGRTMGRSRSRSRGRRVHDEGQLYDGGYGESNGEGSSEVNAGLGIGLVETQRLGVRITDALNWTGLANPEEKVFGCCPHESIVLSCFWPAPGTFPSEPFTIPVRNERGESYTARMIAYVVAQEFREMLTTSPLSPTPDPTLPDFRLVRSSYTGPRRESYTGPRRDPGIRLEDVWITRLWSRDGRVFGVEVRLDG